jgi:ornithine cyclodeaminase/alanine dehydrogenase-like protein (mu-crystallin family)
MAEGPLWISEADVEALLDPAALVMAIADGFSAVEDGRIREAGSTRLDGLDGGNAYMTVYPAHAAGGLASVKLLAGRPANALVGAPEIDAVVQLVDPSEGRIVALVAARALTAYRTAAATAAALTRMLPDRPARIGLVGTGAQALAHARVLAANGLAREFAIASPRGDSARAEATAARIAQQTGNATGACPAKEIVARCDAIILMTLAKAPVDLGTLPDDLVLASIGPFYAHQHELDPAVVAAASLIVSDHPERLRRQWAGSSSLDIDRLHVISLANLIRKADKIYSRGHRVLLSDGRGFQDNIAATMVCRAALAAGRGVRLG